VTIPMLREELRGCHDCPVMVQSRIEVLGQEREQPILPDGTNGAVYMFVGIAPGRAAKGVENSPVERPFGMGSGLILRQAMGQAGYLPKEVYFTNMVKCNTPEDGKIPPSEAAHCVNTWFKRELQELRPKALILLGSEATDLFFETFSVQDYKDLQKSCKIHHLWHPAYVLRNRSKFSEYVDQLRRIRT